MASFSLRLPFFLYAGTLVVAGAIGLGALRNSEMAARQLDQAGAAARCATALRDRAYVAALVASFAGDFAVVGARASIVPQFITDRLGLGTGWVYLAFLIVSVVSGALLLPFGHDRRHPRPPAGHHRRAGRGRGRLPAAALAGHRWPGCWWRWCCSASRARADSVAPGAVLGDVVGGRGGTVVAVFQMAGDLGAVLGPVLAGAMADNHGYGPAFALQRGGGPGAVAVRRSGARNAGAPPGVDHRGPRPA